MKTLKLLFTIALFAVAATSYASGGGGGGDTSAKSESDPVLDQANTAIDHEDWATAQSILKRGLAKNPNNADYHNLYAYSMRKGPNPDMQLVLQHYHEALRINPKHRGAHEYLGEAYLQMGDLAKAKEQLAALDKLCFFKCEEYTDLKEDIEEYENKHAQN